MSKDDFIVFIEVKSLSSKSRYSIYDRLTPLKRKKLKSTINKWLLENSKLNQPWRLDFVGIVDDLTIEHFQFIELS